MTSHNEVVVTIVLVCFCSVLYADVDPYDPDHTKYNWCRYQLFLKHLAWNEAWEACKIVNKTLVNIKDENHYTYLTNLIKNSLTHLAKPQEIESTAWVGSHVDTSGTTRFAGCQINQHGSIQSSLQLTNGGMNCFVLNNQVNPPVTAADCQHSKQFICEAESLDTNTCFHMTSISYMSCGGIAYYCATAKDLCTSECAALHYQGDRCNPCVITANYEFRPRSLSKKVQVDRDKVFILSSITEVREICRSHISYNLGITPTLAVLPSSIHDATTTPRPIFDTTPALSVLPCSIHDAAPTSRPIFDTTPTLSVLPCSIHDAAPTSRPIFDTTPTLSVLPSSIHDATTTSRPIFEATCSPQEGKYCVCNYTANVTLPPLSLEELQSKLQELKKQLMIDKRELSSWKRQLSSATDVRKSSQNIGVAAAISLCLIATFIIMLDMTRLITSTNKKSSRQAMKEPPNKQQNQQAPRVNLDEASVNIQNLTAPKKRLVFLDSSSC